MRALILERKKKTTTSLFLVLGVNVQHTYHTSSNITSITRNIYISLKKSCHINPYFKHMFNAYRVHVVAVSLLFRSFSNFHESRCVKGFWSFNGLAKGAVPDQWGQYTEGSRHTKQHCIVVHLCHAIVLK